MAHYDCKNCGASFGIAYGYCNSCTHQSVIEAKKTLEQATEKAKHKWERETADERQKFIAEETAMARAKYHSLYNNFRPKNVQPL